MVAPRHTAADLQINDAIADAIARNDLPQNNAEGSFGHRRPDLQFTQRALEPREVTALVDQPTLPHLADFVDGVAELVAAILDMHHGLAQRQIATVDVSYSGHC